AASAATTPEPAPTQAAQTGAAPTAVPAAAQAAPTSVPASPTTVPSGPLVEASLANLSKTLHPYPDASSYTSSWIDVASVVWGGAEGSGGLLAFDWDTLDYRPAMAKEMPKVSADGKTFTFTLRDDLKWSDGSPVSVDDFQFAYDQASREENGYVQLDIVQD